MGSIFWEPNLPTKHHQPGIEDTQCALPLRCLRAGGDHDLTSQFWLGKHLLKWCHGVIPAMSW